MAPGCPVGRFGSHSGSVSSSVKQDLLLTMLPLLGRCPERCCSGPLLWEAAPSRRADHRPGRRTRCAAWKWEALCLCWQRFGLRSSPKSCEVSVSGHSLCSGCRRPWGGGQPPELHWLSLACRPPAVDAQCTQALVKHSK